MLIREDNVAAEANVQLFSDILKEDVLFKNESKREEYRRVCSLSEAELENEAARRADVAMERHRGNYIPYLKEMAAVLAFLKLLKE